MGNLIGRFLLHVIGWLPAAFLAWLASPFLIPELLRGQALGLHLLHLLRAGIVVGALAVAWRTAQTASQTEPKAWKILLTGVLFLAGMAGSFLWGALLPTRDLTRSCRTGPIFPEICERYSGGFSPDIPFFRLQRGELANGACPLAQTSTLTWDFGPQTRDLHPAPCPAGLQSANARCFQDEWTEGGGSRYLGLVAFDSGCQVGLELYGRGQAARDRQERLPAF
jgi:hypothetical protein